MVKKTSLRRTWFDLMNHSDHCNWRTNWLRIKPLELIQKTIKDKVTTVGEAS